MHLALPFSFFLSSLVLIHKPIITKANQDNATRHRRLRSKSAKSDNDNPTTSCDEPSNMYWDATLEKCACKDGFKMDEVLNECVDINECEDWKACGTYNYTYYWYFDYYSYKRPSGTCSNTEGGYDCDCLEGTYYDEDSKTCIETNECAEDRHICGEGVCKNIPNGYSCECEGRFRHTPIYNPIEKTCSNSGCGDIHIDYSDGPPEVKEITGNTCGSENIGTCEALPVEYGPNCEDFEAHCSCEQGYKKVNFYDPIDPQNGQNTFQTCIHYSECIGQEDFCTCQEGFHLDYTTHKCVAIVCEDIDAFKFPLINRPNKKRYCAWISRKPNKASSRREKYCNDTHIAPACPNACVKCFVYRDDPDFTFELTKKVVKKPCSWISKNPNAIDGRRITYCFSSDDCTKASDIGDHCPEACGFTEGLHWNKSC